MKIKVFDPVSEQTLYFSGDESPVMIILDETDKENIAEMPHGATKYCQYPKEFHDTIKEFMKTENTENTEFEVD